MMTLVTTGMVLALTTVVGGQSTLEYGADISLPMQHSSASTNYDWLPHNVDPTIETPEEYQGMPLQPLGDRQQFYKEYIEGCVEKFGVCCEEYETERFDMSLRQPHSMQVRPQHAKRYFLAQFDTQPLAELHRVGFQKDKDTSSTMGNDYYLLGKQQGLSRAGGLECL